MRRAPGFIKFGRRAVTTPVEHDEIGAARVPADVLQEETQGPLRAARPGKDVGTPGLQAHFQGARGACRERQKGARSAALEFFSW